MANVLNEEKKQQVLALGRLGWSLRQIQQATRIRRETASAYLKAAGITVRSPGGWGLAHQNRLATTGGGRVEQLGLISNGRATRSTYGRVDDSSSRRSRLYRFAGWHLSRASRRRVLSPSEAQPIKL